MYRIYQKDLYDEHPKAHFASTQKIADAVYEDLQIRFGGMVLEEDDTSCTWDPGGMLMMDDEVFAFSLDNSVVKCKAQHFDYFVDAIATYKVRGDEVKYVKMHGAYACICISPEEFNKLKELVKNPEYQRMADAAFAERERRLNELQNMGAIKRVVKVDDKIYSLPNQADKKGLN